MVAADTPGLKFVRALVLSSPHPLGEIAFHAARVPKDCRLDADGQGFKLGLATLDRLRATVGAAACGMATRALADALAHAKSRRQFGKPLSDFQLIQQKLARMAEAAGESSPGAPSSIAAIRSRRRIFSSGVSAGLSAISSALRAKR